MFGEVGVELGVAVHGAAVVGDDFFEGFEAAIVHVGGGESEVSETWGGEGAGGIESVVVELMVGEVGSAVAVKAVGSELLATGFIFGEEEFHAAFFGGGELLFSVHRAVEFGVVAGEGEEEIFEGQGKFFGGNFVGAEGFGEVGLVAGFEARDDIIEVGVHLGVVEDGHEGLEAKRGGAPIPEEGGFPGEVEEGHGVSGALLLVDAGGEREAIGEGFVGVVAAGAGDGAITGEGGVVEEEFSEGDPFGEEGVVAGEGRHGEAAAHFEREGRKLPGEVERGDGLEGDFGRWVADSANGKASG